MADPVGIGLGVASLAVQLLDGAAKGYQYFIAAANMPKECLELRTKLQIEYYRLLGWADVAGLIEFQSGQELPNILKADKLVLVGVLGQINSLLDDFAAINGRYKDLQPNLTTEQKQEALGKDLLREFASVELKYEAAAKKRQHIRGTNHILAMGKNVKDIATNPKRLWWAAFDANVFKELLRKLAAYNSYLNELLHGHHLLKLEETTRNTFIEMVSVRSSVNELKQLVTAAMILAEHPTNLVADEIKAGRRRNDLILQSLAEFKQASIARDVPDRDRPPDYKAVLASFHQPYNSIYYAGMNDSGEQEKHTVSMRTDAKFSPGDGRELKVWIEWKQYETWPNIFLNTLMPLKENVSRVSELVGLLQLAKPSEFRTPRCLGFFDDRDDGREQLHQKRFGLIFEKPDQAAEHSTPSSLLELIIKEDCPSMTIRVALARKIANSLLYLHAVRWLHKGICSDNILFFQDARSAQQSSAIAWSDPYLCGFEYARPDRDGSTTTGGASSSRYDMYRHPDYQGEEVSGKYRKTFDIYSLGIVLFEIAAWEPIPNIVGIEDPEKAASEVLQAIRGKLLNSKEKYLGGLRAQMGEKYWTAVKACLEGRDTLDVAKGENEMDAVVGAKLQRAFTEKVLGSLAAIAV